MRALLPFLSLFKQNKWQLLLGVLLMIIGLGASVGLLTLSGWFLAATALAGLGTLFNFFYPSSSVRGLAIGRTFARYMEKIVTHDATFRVLAKLRVKIFSKIIPLSPAVLNRYRNSDLLNRLVADVDTLDSLYLRLVAPFVSAITVIILLTIALSLFYVPLALFVGSSLFILLLIIPTIFYHLGKKFGADFTATRAEYRTQFVEFIQAQAELLLFNAEPLVKQRLNQTEQHWQSYQQKETQLTGLSSAILLFCNGIIMVISLWIASQVQFQFEDYPAALIALFAFTALASFEILMPLGAAFLHIGQVIASAERVSELLEQKPLVEFNGNQEIQLSSSPLIEFQQVNFSYPERQDLALQDFNLTIEQGKRVAILGKTGSGKSTLLQLLVRNYNPNQGEILLAGQPISVYSESSLRQHICVLTQRVHTFSDSLKGNLQLANEQATDEQMKQVLAQVGLAHLLDQPAGLELWLGDGGRPLSGGEQRRLGLARILLNDAPIILLDEPTEGLDRETERQMLDLIFEHTAGKTLIMVTHRLTDLEKFDHICIIDDAKLIKQGKFEQLI